MKIRDSALKWAEMGVPVFPLKNKSKKPATKNGFHDASTDVGQINKWFKDESLNLGIATGSVSNLIVIDIDIKDDKNGLKSLESYFGKEFLLPDKSLLFKTPSGGLHIPVKWNEDVDVGCGVNVLGIDGVDLRANDGYVVAAPSRLVIDDEIKSYRVNNINLPITEHYGWITQLLTQFKSSKNKSNFSPVLPMTGINSGERNSRLFSYARHLCAKGFDKGMVLGFVLEASKRCTPPLPESETIQVIESAFSYGAGSSMKNVSKEKLTLEGLL